MRSKKTSLVDLPPDVEAEVRRALGGLEYGATMVKIGWHAQLWDPAYNGGRHLEVLDVAARVGSGVGSYGVARYYALLAARDADGVDVYDSGSDDGVILDVKYEPAPAAAAVLNKYDTAWYSAMFDENHAQRAGTPPARPNRRPCRYRTDGRAACSCSAPAAA